MKRTPPNTAQIITQRARERDAVERVVTLVAPERCPACGTEGEPFGPYLRCPCCDDLWRKATDTCGHRGYKDGFRCVCIVRGPHREHVSAQGRRW